MAKRKLTYLAQALVLVDSLTESDQATLLDYLRSKQPQTPRKAATKKASKKSSSPVVLPNDPDDFKVPF